MAVGHVHHHLVNLQKRSRVGLMLETAEAREVGVRGWGLCGASRAASVMQVPAVWGEYCAGAAAWMVAGQQGGADS